MFKKDYQAIARAIHETASWVREPQPDMDCTPEDAINEIRDRLASILASDNPRFSRERFIEACETGKCKGMPAR